VNEDNSENLEFDTKDIGWKLYNKECEEHKKTLDEKNEITEKTRRLELKLEREKKSLEDRVRDLEGFVDFWIPHMHNLQRFMLSHSSTKQGDTNEYQD